MKLCLLILVGMTTLLAQDGKIRVIAFGAHPDDCDIRVGGTAALWAQMGHAVKFVACTNGDAGHPVVLGQPEPPVSPLLGMACEIERAAKGKASVATFDDGCKIENGVRRHHGDLMPRGEPRCAGQGILQRCPPSPARSASAMGPL